MVPTKEENKDGLFESGGNDIVDVDHHTGSGSFVESTESEHEIIFEADSDQCTVSSLERKIPPPQNDVEPDEENDIVFDSTDDTE